MSHIDAYLKLMLEQHASDLFLTTGAPPSIKIDGIVHALNAPNFQAGDVKAIALEMMNPEQRSQFETTKECNFSWARQGQGRYRINVYFQRGEVAMVLRMIDSQIPDFSALGLPAKIAELSMVKQGLILIVGAAGSGKSTTMAAMIKHRSENVAGHILTIEDPIEFLFKHSKSMVDQREVGIDTQSFAQALHNALRESPDVIMLGEIRDRETAQHAIAYAETGHLCISTLHANNANQAVERMLGFFPEDAHNQVLQDLSLNLQAVISQRLVPAIKRKRIPAVEILLHTAFIADLIQRGKLNEVKDEMAKGNELGMVTFDQSLYALYSKGQITAQQAIQNADSPTNMMVKMRLSEHHSPSDAPNLTLQQTTDLQ